MEPLLTIVVPAYNVEKYLAECLESLINQTMMNHKVIVVNDGSTDGTDAICRSYSNKYPQFITYISQKNKGLGGARNTGLKNVNTPYVTFLDSDDWLNINYVERFNKLIRDTDEDPDLIYTLPWVYDSVSKRIIPWKDKNYYDEIFKAQSGISTVCTNSRLTPQLYRLEVNACRKIYKKEFLDANKFTFPEGLKWEDVPGNFYLLHQANTVMALPETGFFYRTNQGGQITAGGGASRLDMIPIFKQLLDIQNKCEFNEIERGYVLRVIVDFSMWSVSVTNTQYISALLDGLHDIFVKISNGDIQFYLKNVCENVYSERNFIEKLQTNNYSELADYLERDKQSAVKSSIHCIQDHGFKYTCRLIARRYIMKQNV